jgi:hypothetical protein
VGVELCQVVDHVIRDPTNRLVGRELAPPRRDRLAVPRSPCRSQAENFRDHCIDRVGRIAIVYHGASIIHRRLS